MIIENPSSGVSGGKDGDWEDFTLVHQPFRKTFDRD
jgi:hypothetical protein